jgi:hypothetical protein
MPVHLQNVIWVFQYNPENDDVSSKKYGEFEAERSRMSKLKVDPMLICCSDIILTVHYKSVLPKQSTKQLLIN